MDVRQLRYFLAVVDHGGIGRAAEMLRVAQPSLSQAIAGLERQVGVPLFHRVGRGLVLSSSGSALVGPARVVLRDLEQAESAVRSELALSAGRLDIVSMPSPGVEPLTSLLAEFMVRYPHILVNVDAAFTADETLRAVTTGQSEIGLLGTAEPIRVSGIETIPLAQQPFVLVSAPGWLDSEGDTVDLADLHDLRLIVSQRGSLIRSLVDRMLTEGLAGAIVAEVGHRSSILPLVMRQAGQAVLPSAWSDLARRAGADVRTILPETRLHIALVSRTDGLTPAAQAFLEVARASVTA